jgi:hypothetical protein
MLGGGFMTDPAYNFVISIGRYRGDRFLNINHATCHTKCSLATKTGPATESKEIWSQKWELDCL